MEINICSLQQDNMFKSLFRYDIPIDQLALTESNELKACVGYSAHRKEQRLMQFLMALHSDFEGLRCSILYRSPLPFVYVIVNELLAKEIHLESHSEKDIISNLNPSMFTTPSNPTSNNQSRTYTRVAFNECSFCVERSLESLVS